MPDYTLTKIYKIESHLGDKIYVGSTAKQYLSQRFQQHKNSYKQWKEGKVNKVTSYDLFDEYGPENCQIVLIEEYSCNSKDAKNAREGHHIKELNCVNRVVVGRTQQESQNIYNHSQKGKIARNNYLHSDKCKEVLKKYHESEKGKEALKKYQETDKGKEARKKAQKLYYERKKAIKIEQQKQSEPIIN